MENRGFVAMIDGVLVTTNDVDVVAIVGEVVGHIENSGFDIHETAACADGETSQRGPCTILQAA